MADNHSKASLIRQLQTVRDHLMQTTDIDTVDVLAVALVISHAIELLKRTPTFTEIEQARGRLDSP